MRRMIGRAVGALALVALVSACAGMNSREQRVLSGGAIGAGSGAAIGALTGGSVATGAAVGGIVGSVGGLVVDEMQRR